MCTYARKALRVRRRHLPNGAQKHSAAISIQCAKRWKMPSMHSAIVNLKTTAAFGSRSPTRLGMKRSGICTWNSSRSCANASCAILPQHSKTASTATQTTISIAHLHSHQGRRNAALFACTQQGNQGALPVLCRKTAQVKACTISTRTPST